MKRTRSEYIVALVILCACSEGVTPPAISVTPDCTQAGRSYSGVVPAGTWRQVDSPHILLDSVSVTGRLVIEPGTLICAVEGASLEASWLVAEGTAEEPVVFTSRGPEPWRGITADSGLVRNARIENTVIAATGQRGLILEGVHIANTQDRAVHGVSTMIDVVIEKPCVASSSCVAVVAHGLGQHMRLVNVTIRDSGGGGVYGFARCSITMDGVVIEGSAGTGLEMPWAIAQTCGLTVERPVTITGGGSYPARVWGQPATALLRSGSELTGNARDTLLIDGWWGLDEDDYRVGADLPWVVESICEGMNTWRHRLGRIVVSAGASLSIRASHCMLWADIVVEGTAANPATIISDGMRVHSRGVAQDTVRVQHAVIHGVRFRADSAAMVFEDVEMHDSSLELHAPGSRIDGLRSVSAAIRATVTDADTADPSVVTLGAGTSIRRADIRLAGRDGISVTGTAVTIERCTVTQSARHGIRVLTGRPVIHECNLYGNSGFGLSNLSAQSTLATGNWWGDANGPFAPAGDGIEGSVDYEPFRNTPVSW